MRTGFSPVTSRSTLAPSAAWQLRASMKPRMSSAKSISIKGAKRRSGGCAQKAAELTPGDLLRVASATEAVERRPDRGAEVSRGRSPISDGGGLGHQIQLLRLYGRRCPGNLNRSGRAAFNPFQRQVIGGGAAKSSIGT